MKRITCFIAIFAIVFVFIAGFGNAYDQVKPEDTVIATDFNSTFSYVKVVSYGLATGLAWFSEKGRYQLKQGHFWQEGSGVIVAAGYVLTAAHVIKPNIIRVAESSCATRITDVISVDYRVVNILDYKNAHIPATIFYENEHTDLAVLKYNFRKNRWLRPIPYPLEFKGVSPTFEALKTGDVVCAVVHERDSDGEIDGDVKLSWGTVLHPGPHGPSDIFVAWLSPWDITLDVIIQGGDSGSPLFAFRDGKPILIGIMRARYMSYSIYYSYARLLPVVVKLIKGKR